VNTVGKVTTTHPRSYEVKLRKQAERQGYRLRGSKRRDPNALDYKTWRIETPRGRTVVAGSLEVIETWLATPREQRT
jgi:hypothetical protein